LVLEILIRHVQRTLGLLLLLLTILTLQLVDTHLLTILGLTKLTKLPSRLQASLKTLHTQASAILTGRFAHTLRL
jgi:hypothetical protein